MFRAHLFSETAGEAASGDWRAILKGASIAALVGGGGYLLYRLNNATYHWMGLFKPKTMVRLAWPNQRSSRPFLHQHSRIQYVISLTIRGECYHGGSFSFLLFPHLPPPCLVLLTVLLQDNVRNAYGYSFAAMGLTVLPGAIMRMAAGYVSSVFYTFEMGLS